jgi:hypothetical protein
LDALDEESSGIRTDACVAKDNWWSPHKRLQRVQAALAPSTLLKAIAVGVSGVATACLLMYFSSVTESDRAKTGTATTLTLGHNASSVQGKYVGWRVAIVKGAGEGQTRTVTEYDADTKVLTVDPQWYCDPDATSRYMSSCCAACRVSCSTDTCESHICFRLPWRPPVLPCTRNTRGCILHITYHQHHRLCLPPPHVQPRCLRARAPINPSPPKP